MKKTLLASALLALASSAFALDVGVVGGYDNNLNNGFAGVTVGQKFGKLGVTGGFERTTAGIVQNRWNLTGSYNVMKIGSVTLVGKGGVVYLDNEKFDSGWAGQVGAGVEIPLTAKLAATVDYRYQFGQTRVDLFNGSTVFAGVKYSF